MKSIKTAIEEFFKAELDSYVPNLPIFVARRDENVAWDDSYAVVRVDDMQETDVSSEVWYADVQIWLISHIDDATSEKHSENLRMLKHGVNLIHADHSADFPFNAPSGCRVYGLGPKRVSEAELDQAFGDVIYLDNCGFGIVRGTRAIAPSGSLGEYLAAVDLALQYDMKTLWSETKKIDATGGAMIASIPAGTIRHNAFTTTAGKKITLMDDSGTSILAPNESVAQDQIVLPGSQELGVYGAVQIRFEAGSEGTVNYVSLSNLGPITVEAE